MNAQLNDLLKDIALKRSIRANGTDVFTEKLFGSDALMDSLDFIHFILDVEQGVLTQFGKKINLRKSLLEKGTDSLKSLESFCQFVAKEL